MKRKQPNGSRLRTARWAASGRSTNSTPMSALEWSKTFWDVSPTASTVDALLANLPSEISHGGGQRRGSATIWRTLEQSRRASGLRFEFFGARRSGDLRQP